MDLQKYVVKCVSKDEVNGIQIVELNNGQKLELKQNWFDSIIEVGDTIAVGIDNKDEVNQQIITINTAENFFILNPDHLVTSTELSNSTFCNRKTWLGSRFKFYGESNYYALIGTLIHCLFQETVSEKNLTKKVLDATLSELIKQAWVLKTLIILNKTEDNLIRDSREYVASIIKFNRKYGKDPKTNPPVEFDQNQPHLKIRINKVTDIEDTILAPNYGLKGKIDATMNVILYDTRDKEKTTLVKQKTPFELKTGKVSFSYAHQAQVGLYTLMIDNLYNKCNFGLLAYLKGEINMKYITMTRFVRNDLLIQRNELVHYMKYLQIGPKARSNTSFCSNCEHLLDCCLLGKIYEPNKMASFEIYQPDLLNSTLSHLNEDQINFFKHWIEMIYFEEISIKDNSDQIFWNKSSIELEATGKAIAKLALHKLKDNKYEYKFRRDDNYRNLGPLPVDIQFHKNVERITLSIENDDGKFEKIAFLNGVIISIDHNFVTVQLDEIINEDHFDKTFRLDILPIQPSFSYLYSSILSLMDKEKNSEFLRELIIDNRRPTYEETQSEFELSIVNEIIRDLNFCQQNAVRRSLKTKQYLLIIGYPGSGKTETILHLIRILAKLNKSIVITAHTNQAVDNILLKLVKYEIDFMRIGNPSRIHPDLISYSEELLINNCTSISEMKRVYSSINVFAGTCYSMSSHMIFKLRLINYCIVDEASQINLPENLLPLFNCDRFILVGDPNQLNPIVKSKKAKKAGFDTTLLEMLLKIGDNNVELTIQYRMNKEILRIANHCTYNNKLTCASDEIANATLNFVKPSEFEMQIDQPANKKWIEKCLNNDLESSVLFLDTDDHDILKNELIDDTAQIFNLFEVDIISKIVVQLLGKGIIGSTIGIITFYQKQVKILKSTFSNNLDIEVSTIDQYQGRDKDIILISCVRVKNSTDETEVNGILNDERRLNVAITRCKKKFILIGSQSTLINYHPFKKLFSSFRQNQIIKV